MTNSQTSNNELDYSTLPRSDMKTIKIAFDVDGTAVSKQTVQAALAIAKTADLDYGAAPQGLVNAMAMGGKEAS